MSDELVAHPPAPRPNMVHHRRGQLAEAIPVAWQALSMAAVEPTDEGSWW